MSERGSAIVLEMESLGFRFRLSPTGGGLVVVRPPEGSATDDDENSAIRRYSRAFTDHYDAYAAVVESELARREAGPLAGVPLEGFPPLPLPPLPEAASNDVGALARRLLEWADLSALPPLLDALGDRGRDADGLAIRAAFAGLMQRIADAERIGNTDPGLTEWSPFVAATARVVWWDLFDFNACVRRAAAALDPPTIPQRWARLVEELQQLTAAVENEPIAF